MVSQLRSSKVAKTPNVSRKRALLSSRSVYVLSRNSPTTAKRTRPRMDRNRDLLERALIPEVCPTRSYTRKVSRVLDPFRFGSRCINPVSDQSGACWSLYRNRTRCEKGIPSWGIRRITQQAIGASVFRTQNVLVGTIVSPPEWSQSCECRKDTPAWRNSGASLAAWL